MNGLTRDGTAEQISRDQFFRRKRVQRKNILPVQLTTSRGLATISTLLIYTLLFTYNIKYDHSTVNTLFPERRSRVLKRRSEECINSGASGEDTADDDRRPERDRQADYRWADIVPIV